MLSILVDVKFRAFGVTFGHVHISENIQVPFPVPVDSPTQLFTYNDHGVMVVLTAEPAK